jgi:ergothioneine biosynthesis protein EgtB
MHDEASLAAIRRVAPAALSARQGDAGTLGLALAASRADTLATFAVYEAALPGLQVPQRAELNPPLWELGHIGWFQEFWIGRNPLRGEGHRADAEAARYAPRRANADALYNSSKVPHDTRWSLPLPDADTTRSELAAQLAQTLACLWPLRGAAAPDDDALYFYRLALLHEDMHHEAALYMARGLGLAIADPRWQAAPLPEPPAELGFDAAPWRLGEAQPRGSVGFVFDNEVGRLDVPVAPCRIDAQARRWADYLPFIEAGGYAEHRHWSEAGWAWRTSTQAQAPRYLRRADAGHWEQWRHGQWLALDLREPACHLTHHEAEAWCRWAGRRLPTEAEWERAALTQPDAFRWGDVWEWTATPFSPYSGFSPHPYRDYSAPWFDGRPVLRGASFMTQPRMKHPRYRNFFQAHRNDVPAGLRSCAL